VKGGSQRRSTQSGLVKENSQGILEIKSLSSVNILALKKNKFCVYIYIYIYLFVVIYIFIAVYCMYLLFYI
jgi:hypothetical protein